MTTLLRGWIGNVCLAYGALVAVLAGATSCGSPAGDWNAAAALVPLTYSKWAVMYDGFGSVAIDPEAGILLAPMGATQPGETHAALVLAQATLDRPIGDFRIELSITTERQVRAGESPRPWECFWLLFNAQARSGNIMRANYFIFKTNGVELGRAFDGTGQAFLTTADAPRMEVGMPSTLTLEKRGDQFEASINGKRVLYFRSDEASGKFLYREPGSIGLYAEGSRVRVHWVRLDAGPKPL